MSVTDNLKSKDTPFMKFWAAINDYCDSEKVPEPTYGTVRLAWSEALTCIATAPGDGGSNG